MIEFVIFFLLGFIFEYIDTSVGGGYGTCLTPIFLLMGYPPIQIVPMILVSESVTGFWGGFNHYRYGNVDKKVAFVVATLAVVGSLVGMFFVVSASGTFIKTYIGILVVAMGILTILKKVLKVEHRIGLKGIAGIGLLCGFNKLLTGGGFGPVSTAGCHLSGVDIKKSVGSTTLAEGIMSLSGIGLYASLLNHIQWNLAIPLVLGAVLSCVPSTYTTHKSSKKMLPVVVGCFMLFFGVLTLMKTYLG